MRRSAVAIAFTAVATAVSFQDGVRTIALRPPEATLGEPFTRIYSIRELTDGRVLISDNSVESRLVVADLRTGRVRKIGRIGAGPGEYLQAGRLFALGGDSTLFIDAPQRGRRWLLLHRDSIVTTLPPDLPVWRVVGADIVGVDTARRLFGIRGAGADRLSSTLTRSRSIAVLTDWNGQHADTLVQLRGDDVRTTQTTRGGRPFWISIQLMGSVEDQALLFPDGWIAVVRQEPYRVEWRSPTGSRTSGPDQRWVAPKSDATERRAYADRVRRRSGRTTSVDDEPWADRLAPFPRNALIPTADQRLLVLRSQWSREPDTRYDLFDRTGQALGKIVMPDSERVIGFGRASVFTVITDGDGFQKLRRHPWP